MSTRIHGFSRAAHGFALKRRRVRNFTHARRHKGRSLDTPKQNIGLGLRMRARAHPYGRPGKAQQPVSSLFSFDSNLSSYLIRHGSSAGITRFRKTPHTFQRQVRQVLEDGPWVTAEERALGFFRQRLLVGALRWVENKESSPNTNTVYQPNIKYCPNIDIQRIRRDF